MSGEGSGDGKGVPRDIGRAVRFAGMACDGGHAESCGKVGGAYFGGTGVNRDLAKALFYLKKACEGGSQKACQFLKQVQQ